MPTPHLKLPPCLGGTYVSRTRLEPDTTCRYFPRHCGFSRSAEAATMDESLSAITEQAIWRYVVRGTVTWMVGERRATAGPGTVIATRQPSNGRLLLPDGTVDLIWLTLQGPAALDYFDRITHRFGNLHLLAPGAAAVRRAEEMIRVARRNRPRSPFFWSEQTFLFLSAWHRGLEERRQPLLPLVRMAPQDARDLLTSVRSVKSFAAQVGYSQSHLTRLIARTWRETPGKVFRRVRLEEAARHLRDGDATVADVAGRAGYSSVPAFITAFKARFGLTPAAYRRSRR